MSHILTGKGLLQLLKLDVGELLVEVRRQSSCQGPIVYLSPLLPVLGLRVVERGHLFDLLLDDSLVFGRVLNPDMLLKKFKLV